MTSPVSGSSDVAAKIAAMATAGTPAPQATSTESKSKTEVDKDMFLKLLVAQLKYQDPTKPADTTQFLAQTAQFTVVEKLSELKPVFRPDGEVTAGNACPLNDGAAAVIVMSDQRAAELGITPLARIVASGVTGLNPEIMGLGPIEACRQALRRAGMTIDDIDLVEINEAFAAQVIPSARALGIDFDKLSVNGGAIALGHPFGMTGARIMGTLLNGLEDANKTVGLETMCVGGGQGMAMVVERLS